MSKLKVWVILVVVVLVLVFVATMGPTPLSVEVALVENRTFSMTVEDQGRTRAKDPYIVATPITGRLLRSNFDEGDVISEGQALARIALPPDDRRTEAVSQANLAAAQARYSAVEAALMEAESAYDRAQQEDQRRGELLKDNLVSSEERETYRQLVDAAEARLMTTQASVQAALAEIESARSLLLGVNWDDEKMILSIVSPVDGTIYQIYEESERVLTAGTPLYSISNDDTLEIIVDLLTQDAVQVEPGDKILISGWGGDSILEGVVNYIEPQAFTKISALGVEEQRVNVIGEFNLNPDSLGAEYRIEAAIVVWEEDNVLTIPSSAIFQRTSGWSTFVVVDDVAELRSLEIGNRGREYAQVLGGVDEGESVILFPSDLIEEGTEISY